MAKVRPCAVCGREVVVRTNNKYCPPCKPYRPGKTEDEKFENRSAASKRTWARRRAGGYVSKQSILEQKWISAQLRIHPELVGEIADLKRAWAETRNA